MSFADLKAKANDMSALVGAAGTSTTEKKSYGDDRMWKPTVDKAGNGYAVIRFLPAVEGDDLPWAKYWDHFFQGPTGQWYVEKSLTSACFIVPPSFTATPSAAARVVEDGV